MHNLFDRIRIVDEYDENSYLDISKNESGDSFDSNKQRLIVPKSKKFLKVKKIEFFNDDYGQKLVWLSKEEDLDEVKRYKVDYKHFLQIKEFEKEIKQIQGEIQTNWEEIIKPRFIIMLRECEDETFKERIFVWKNEWTCKDSNNLEKENLIENLKVFYEAFRFHVKGIQCQVASRMKMIFFKALRAGIRELFIKVQNDKSKFEEINQMNTMELIEMIRESDLGIFSPLYLKRINLNSIVYNTFITTGVLPITSYLIQMNRSYPLFSILKRIYAPWTEKFHASFIIGDVLYDYTNEDSIEQMKWKGKIIRDIKKVNYSIPILDFFPLDHWVEEMAHYLGQLLFHGNPDDFYENRNDSAKAFTYNYLENKANSWAESFMKCYKEAFDHQLIINISKTLAETEIKGYSFCKNNCQTPLLKLIYYLNEEFSKHRDSIHKDFPVQKKLKSVDSSINYSDDRGNSFDESIPAFESEEISEWRSLWSSEFKIMTANKMLNYFGIWGDESLREYLNNIISNSESKLQKNKELTELENLLSGQNFFEIKKKLKETIEDKRFFVKDKICYLHFKLRKSYLDKRMKHKKNLDFLVQLENYRKEKEEIEGQIVKLPHNSEQINKKQKEINGIIKYYLSGRGLTDKNVEELIIDMKENIRKSRGEKNITKRVFTVFACFYYESVRERNALKLTTSFSYIGHLFIRDPKFDCFGEQASSVKSSPSK